jgi:predicted MPP superfamily phosphohydrolase
MSRGRDTSDLLALAKSAPARDLRIVIGHNPNFVQDLAEASVGVDLALAGHTHGGQVVLPLFGPPITQMSLPRRYASGLHDYRGIPLHVSAGIGMERGTAPQIRFNCPPEISVIEVRY